MTSSTFTILCNHHHCPFPDLFIIIPNRTVMSFFASLHGMQDLCSLTRGGTRAPAVETQSPNPCTAGEFPELLCLLHAGFLQVGCPVPTIPTWIPHLNLMPPHLRNLPQFFKLEFGACFFVFPCHSGHTPVMTYL